VRNMPKYEVIVKTDTGIPLFILTQFTSLTAGRFDRAIMPLEITMPQDDELYPVGTFTKDMILELWREQNQTMVLDGETCYFLRNPMMPITSLMGAKSNIMPALHRQARQVLHVM